MTKVGIDIRMLNSSGIGTTIQGLLGCFSKDQMRQVELFGPKDFSTPYEHGYVPIDAPVYSLTQHWSYGRLLNKRNLSLYHMPHYDVPASYNGKLVITIHDLIHLMFPQYSTKAFSKIYAQWMLNHSISKSRKIICVSENTKKDVLRYFPKADGKIVVIHPAVGDEFCPVDERSRRATLEKYNLKDGYLLYVGNLRASKNSRNLVQGYMELKSKRPETPPLVLVGKNFYPDWEKGIPGAGVRMLGGVDFRELPSLYSGACLFVFPSLYEGFGLPPLEAMACGVPVLTSRIASLPEVCGEAAEYLDDASSVEIARKIEALLGAPERLRILREKGRDQVKRFSWERFSLKTWDVYREVSGQ